MTYFGGTGSGKGWLSLKFLLTPGEFANVFDGLKYSFVITDTRVDLHYAETPKRDFFRACERYFEQLLVGWETLTAKEISDIESPVRQSVIDDIAKVPFEEIKDRHGRPLPYKSAEPLEPVIGVAPFDLLYSLDAEKESLSTAFSNKEGMLGLQLSYPRYVTWCDPGNSGTVETSVFAGKTLFETLAERIKRITKNAKVQSPHKLFKPGFRISENAASVINGNQYLKNNRLEIR